MSELSSIASVELPGGAEVGIWRRRFSNGDGPKVAVIAGIRGDTPEGVRVCQLLGRFLAELPLSGTVDLYPCINPLAAHVGQRRWPSFDVDLHRRFPGRADGHTPDRVIAALMAELEGCEQVVELKGAHPAFREDVQAHVRTDQDLAAERASWCNVQVVWKRGERAEGSLSSVIPSTIELEGGCGNRLSEGVGQTLCDGVLNLLARMEIFPEKELPFHWATIQRPVIVGDQDVLRLRAERGGFFLPLKLAGEKVKEGEVLGEVVDGVTGDLRERLEAPMSGRLLAMREQPMVYPGTLVARLVGR
ncbi:MAG TPA: succinylglutamate desuccinylase/aspartoacylase family protein [Myxococcota bacterium]|nr:succinylglutamate desuccinylase/aspartoacylase family protein [Myxococcota bacterium]HNH46971.1 succinylglutamate desuccinylase/aspartoacylase family protein [Myxococcota bacterium]